MHGQAEIGEVPVAVDVDGFQVGEQRRSLEPRRARRGIHDVVAVERADGDELHVLHVQARQELRELLADFVEARLAPVDEVHLVDGHDEVRDAQQRGDASVAAALFDDPQAGIHEDDGQSSPTTRR